MKPLVLPEGDRQARDLARVRPGAHGKESSICLFSRLHFGWEPKGRMLEGFHVGSCSHGE